MWSMVVIRLVSETLTQNSVFPEPASPIISVIWLLYSPPYNKSSSDYIPVGKRWKSYLHSS